MKVLLVSQEYPPETHWGGIATYLSILAPALARAGAEVHVLSVVPGQPRRAVTTDGVTVHRAPLVRPRGVGRITGMSETWGRLSLAWNVARELRRIGLQPDVIEGTAWNAETLFLARRRVAPLVVHSFSSAYEILPLLGPLTIDRRAAIWLETDLLRRADLVTGTPGQLEKVAPRVGLDAARVREITCPVATVSGGQAAGGPPTVCFVGRFESRKGPDTLVRAWPKVVAAVPGARLQLSGHDTSDSARSSFAAHLRSLAAELGVAGDVVITERWGDHAEVLAEMAAATVCAMPSRWESFGYVAAEASALGRPVIASNIPALAEVVTHGETGLLVDAEDVDGWAEAISRLLTDREWAEAMGRAGRARMVSERDPDLIAAQTLAIYDEAIARHEQASPRARAWR